MIADLRPYPEYKKSGSRWLERVPEISEWRNLQTLTRSRPTMWMRRMEMSRRKSKLEGEA